MQSENTITPDELIEVIGVSVEQRLFAAREKQNGFLKRWSDPDMSKDASENSERDVLMEQMTDNAEYIKKLEKYKPLPIIPGCWNIGDFIDVQYKRIVFNGMDLDTPKITYLLVEMFDISVLPKDIKVTDLPFIPLDVSSHLGKAIVHTADKSLRVNTSSGYCEVELERGVKPSASMN